MIPVIREALGIYPEQTLSTHLTMNSQKVAQQSLRRRTSCSPPLYRICRLTYPRIPVAVQQPFAMRSTMMRSPVAIALGQNIQKRSVAQIR